MSFSIINLKMKNMVFNLNQKIYALYKIQLNNESKNFGDPRWESSKHGKHERT